MEFWISIYTYFLMSCICLFFLPALGLHCWAWAFFSRCQWGLLSSCSMWVSHRVASSVAEYEFLDSTPFRCRVLAPGHVESSRTRNRTCIPLIGRRILNHWTTRQILCISLRLLNIPSKYHPKGSTPIFVLKCPSTSGLTITGYYHA